uniref:Uncharacterized protein n=1 Tax=Bactrocera dorsalis TaxID=27457 RepID=A0A034W8E8_BACDO
MSRKASPMLRLQRHNIFLVNHVAILQILSSTSAVLFTLAKQAKLLQANKLCLVVNKRLQSLKPPAGVQEQIDVCFYLFNAVLPLIINLSSNTLLADKLSE